MSHVASLISNPAKPAVTPAVIAAARALLPSVGPTVILAPRIAADIPFMFEGGDTRALSRAVREKLGRAAVDVVLHPIAHRRKKLFVADMDSTMIRQECIDELADYAGLKTRVAAITERAMRGEIEFTSSLRERIALLKGLPVGVIDEVLQKRIQLMPGARTLVQTMRKNGARTCLVSGGFTLFTREIATQIGFEEDRANRLIIEDGKLAGKVEEPIFGRDAKLAALKELTAKFKLDPAVTLAAGDGANDLDMIREAGLGVAFHAKPVVAEAAAAQIDHGDLTALLYLQGYKSEEFLVV
jgi:phosphoserine phosphatase